MMECSPFKVTEEVTRTKRIMVTLTVDVARMVASKKGLAQTGIGVNLVKIIVIMIMIKIFRQTILRLEEYKGAMALVVLEALEHVGVQQLDQD